MRILLILGVFTAAVQGQFDGLTSLQEVLDLSVSQYKIVGLAASLFTDSALLMKAQSGERKLGEGSPVQFEDQWIMGSNTKSMVATVAAKVVVQGLISWNSTAKEMFQEGGLFDIHPGYFESTLQLFLSHGGGAPGLGPVQEKYGFLLDDLFNRTSWDEGHDNRADRLYLSSTILKDPPTQALGSFEYSIGGFTIAGAMLEVATGKTFEQLCRELLFEPLEMDGCGFGPTTIDPSLPPKQPWGHLSDPFAYHHLPVPPSPLANIASAMVPDGGIKCDLTSWRKYLTTHLVADPTFLPPQQWEILHTPIVFGFYGFGWFIDSSNPAIGKVLTHGGTDGHNYANCVLIPQYKIAGNFGMNDGIKVESSIQAIAYDKILEWMFLNALGKEEVGHVLDVVARASTLVGHSSL